MNIFDGLMRIYPQGLAVDIKSNSHSPFVEKDLNGDYLLLIESCKYLVTKGKKLSESATRDDDLVFIAKREILEFSELHSNEPPREVVLASEISPKLENYSLASMLIGNYMSNDIDKEVSLNNLCTDYKNLMDTGCVKSLEKLGFTAYKGADSNLMISLREFLNR